MLLFDRYGLDDAAKVRYTDDGYMVAMPRVARTGIQLYYGSELGLGGADAKKVMKVYRPEEEVFKADSLHSFGHKPFTDNHPPVGVTADNWREYARGQSGEDVLRDGEFIRVPMVLMDAGVIKKFKDGKAELSVGYECEIEFTPGTSKDGVAYDAKQKNIFANHIAVVDAARGGEQLRIGDGTGKKVEVSAHADGLRAIMNGQVDKTTTSECTACLAGKEYPFALADGTVSLAALRSCKANAIAKGDGDVLAAVDSMLSLIESPTQQAAHDGSHTTETKQMKIITVDGVSVEVANDQAAQIIDKALTSLTSQLKASKDAFAATEAENEKMKKTKVEEDAKSVTALATKDAEIATLKKQVEDSKMTPAKLDELVKDRAVIVGKARAVLGDKLVIDGKTDTEIMTQVVSSNMGDVAKDWNPEQVKVSFETITKDVKPGPAARSGVLETAAAFSSNSVSAADVAAVHAARDKKISSAWKDNAGAA